MDSSSPADFLAGLFQVAKKIFYIEQPPPVPLSEMESIWKATFSERGYYRTLTILEGNRKICLMQSTDDSFWAVYGPGLPSPLHRARFPDPDNPAEIVPPNPMDFLNSSKSSYVTWIQNDEGDGFVRRVPINACLGPWSLRDGAKYGWLGLERGEDSLMHLVRTPEQGWLWRKQKNDEVGFFPCKQNLRYLERLNQIVDLEDRIRFCRNFSVELVRGDFLLQKIHTYSSLDDKLRISCDRWTISIVSTNTSSIALIAGHAAIVFEGIEEGSYFCTRADFHTEETKGLLTRKVRGIVTYGRWTYNENEISHQKSWRISSHALRRTISKIKEQVKKPPEYSLLSWNCLDWSANILKRHIKDVKDVVSIYSIAPRLYVKSLK